MHGRVDVRAHALVRDGLVFVGLLVEERGFVEYGRVVFGEGAIALGAQVELVRDGVREFHFAVCLFDGDVFEVLEGRCVRAVAKQVLVVVEADVVDAGEALDVGILAEVRFELGDGEAVVVEDVVEGDLEDGSSRDARGALALTFLVMYLGPGFGSMPSSVRSRIHVVQRLVRFESVVVRSLVLLGLGVFGLRVRRLLSTCLITRRCLRVRGLGLGLCDFVLHVCNFFGLEISSRGLPPISFGLSRG